MAKKYTGRTVIVDKTMYDIMIHQNEMMHRFIDNHRLKKKFQKWHIKQLGFK